MFNLSKLLQLPVRFLARVLAPTALLAATALLATAAHAGDFKYWYYDEHGNFNPGDLSLGGVLIAPAWACAMRFDSGKTLQWIGQYGVTVGAIDSAPQFKAQTRGDSNGCRPKPAIERMDNTKLYPKDDNNVEIKTGFHYLVIPAGGSYWIDKNGKWPFCNNCLLPGSFTTLVKDSRWALLDATFQAQREGAGLGQAWNISSLSLHLVPLQRNVSTEVSRRRLALFGDRETPVRQLEDLAIASIDKAVVLVEECRRTQAAGARSEAYRACSMARDSATLAKTALRVVQDAVSP